LLKLNEMNQFLLKTGLTNRAALNEKLRTTPYADERCINNC
jgi:hypothetical protein